MRGSQIAMFSRYLVGKLDWQACARSKRNFICEAKSTWDERQLNLLVPERKLRRMLLTKHKKYKNKLPLHFETKTRVRQQAHETRSVHARLLAAIDCFPTWPVTYWLCSRWPTTFMSGLSTSQSRNGIPSDVWRERVWVSTYLLAFRCIYFYINLPIYSAHIPLPNI